MFLTILELLKDKKENNKKQEKNIKKENNEKSDTNNFDDKDNDTNTNTKKRKKNKIQKREKTPRLNKKTNNKKIKKEQKRLKKKQKQKLFYNEEHYSYLYQIILYIIFIIFSINLLSYVFFKGYSLEGSLEVNGNNYKFIPTQSKLEISEYPNFDNLEVGDTLYLIYNSHKKEFKCSKTPKLWGFCLKGTIYKITDYYIYTNFCITGTCDFNNYTQMEITKEGYNVEFKKFLFNYYIYKDSISEIKNLIEESSIQKNN